MDREMGARNHAGAFPAGQGREDHDMEERNIYEEGSGAEAEELGRMMEEGGLPSAPGEEREDPFLSDGFDVAPEEDKGIAIEVSREEAEEAAREAEAARETMAAREAEDTGEMRTGPSVRRIEVLEQSEKVVGDFVSSSAHVTTIGRQIGYKTFEMELAEDIQNVQRLAASYSKKTRTGPLMYGKIIRVTERRGGEGAKQPFYICAWVKCGYVDVLIPHTQFMQWGEEDTRETIRYRMNSYMGAEIGYYVHSVRVDDKDGRIRAMAAGSRLDVLRHDLLVNWLTPDSRTGRYLVEEGREYEAVIDRVMANRLSVNLFGYTADIPVEDVIFGYAANLREFTYPGREEPAFVPGGHIGVLVKSVTRTESGGRASVSAELSIKETASSRERYAYILSNLDVHRDVVRGRVEGYSTKSGSVFVRTDMGYTILCHPVKEIVPPARGSSVLVRITHIDESQAMPFIYGSIIRVL